MQTRLMIRLQAREVMFSVKDLDNSLSENSSKLVTFRKSIMLVLFRQAKAAICNPVFPPQAKPRQ